MISGPSEPPSGPPSGRPPQPPPGPPVPPGPPGPPPGMRPGTPGAGAPQGKRKRDPLPFIIAGVVVLVVAAICCLGGALVLFERRTTPDPSPTPTPPPPPSSGEPLPSPGSSGSEGGGNPLTGADCLLGVWRETSYTGMATIEGTTVWMRNGKQFQSAALEGSIGPESYACYGGKLTENGEGHAIELERVTG